MGHNPGTSFRSFYASILCSKVGWHLSISGTEIPPLLSFLGASSILCFPDSTSCPPGFREGASSRSFYPSILCPEIGWHLSISGTEIPPLLSFLGASSILCFLDSTSGPSGSQEGTNSRSFYPPILCLKVGWHLSISGTEIPPFSKFSEPFQFSVFSILPRAHRASQYCEYHGEQEWITVKRNEIEQKDRNEFPLFLCPHFMPQNRMASVHIGHRDTPPSLFSRSRFNSLNSRSKR